jgi:long-chain acyl-CoA synthetase
MANHPEFGSVTGANLKCSVGGGMAVQSATAALWLEKTGCPICEGYGLSETSPSATCNPVDSTAYTGTIGLPLPNTELACSTTTAARCPWARPARSRSAARR